MKFINYFRMLYYLSFILILICISLIYIIINIDIVEGNFNTFKISGNGDMQTRSDTENLHSFASMINASSTYESNYVWGKDKFGDAIIPKFTDNYEFHSESKDKKWQNAYRISSTHADYLVSWTATKLTGDDSFASTITMETSAEGNKNYDAHIKVDTRDGSAKIEGRVYNYISGKPATEMEVSLVGSFIFDHQLNISQEPYTPENWLGSCESMNRDVFVDELGIYILPKNTDQYNYTYDGKNIIPSINQSR